MTELVLEPGRLTLADLRRVHEGGIDAAKRLIASGAYRGFAPPDLLSSGGL
jgi:hypothetical protein